MKKIHQVNVQLGDDDYAAFVIAADDLNLKLSTLLGKAAKDWIQFYYYKIQRGDITLSKSIIKKIFESIDSKKYDGIAEYNSTYMINEMKSQEGDLPYLIFVDHILKWNKGNHITFKKIPQDGADMFISKHNICSAWSEIQCKTYAKAFKLIGETVLDMEYDSDESFSLKVVRHSNS